MTHPPGAKGRALEAARAWLKATNVRADSLNVNSLAAAMLHFAADIAREHGGSATKRIALRRAAEELERE